MTEVKLNVEQYLVTYYVPVLKVEETVCKKSLTMEWFAQKAPRSKGG